MDRDKKRQQEQQERIFSELLKDDANQHCADCGARGPKWASWNIGVFLCIRCGGVHRKLGTHISKVKSITLDTWTAEQIESIRGKGNAKANLLFNPNGITPPRNPSDRDLENYIRDKYERKVFMSASSRATLAATSASTPSSSSSHASHSHSHSGGAAAYTQQLRQLHDMGFTHDPFNIQALDQAKGNVQAAVELIIAMGPPPASAPTPSTYAAPRPAANTNAFFKQAPAQFDSSSPAMRQLKGMGFTDEPVTLLALQKADGNLDAAILWLTEKADQLKAEVQRNGGGSSAGGRFDQTQYAQQFLAQQQQAHPQQPQSRGMSPTPQQQQQPQQPQKPKNDLLDLFGDGDPFASAAPAQPAMQPFGGGAMGMGMGMGGGMMGGMMQQSQQQPFGNMGSTPNPFGGMQPQQQQQQQPANPFAGGNVGFSNTGSSGGGSAPNPFGDFVSATPAQPQQQQQQQQRTGVSSGGAASDILSLYNQPKPQQQAFGGMGIMQQPQAQQGMMMGGGMMGGMQPQQQHAMMGGGMGMQHSGMMQQPQQQMMMGGGGMQANPFGGAGMGAGMMMGGGGGMPQQQQQQQQSGFGNMGITGMGMGMGMGGSAGTGGNYSMVSTPFNAAQQPKTTPPPFGASVPAAATPDPFAGLGNMAAFGQTQQQQKPAANNTNPFM